MIVYINGQLLPVSEARISPLDYGFMYGFSLFETLRSYDGKLFRLSEHLKRLRTGVAYLGFSSLPEGYDMEKAIRDTILANSVKDARIRLTFSIGEGSLSPDTSSCHKPNLIVTVSSFLPPDIRKFEQGYKLILSEYRRDSLSPLSKVKSGNYLASLLARREAKEKGADEALLFNERGFLSECSSANLFLIKRGSLITPHKNSGILPGITRQEVLNIGLSMGLKIEEREVIMEELFQAEESFITSSLLEIMPLYEIDGKVSHKLRFGNITGRIHQKYQDTVTREST